MNRSRAIPRDFEGEGSERSQQLGMVLSMLCDPRLLEHLIHHIGALQEFGGELYIGTDRMRVNSHGEHVTHGGSFETVAYVIGYNKTSRIKGQEREPDAPYDQAEGLPEEPTVEIEMEPVGADRE
jgi:hypothetical protein